MSVVNGCGCGCGDGEEEWRRIKEKEQYWWLPSRLRSLRLRRSPSREESRSEGADLHLASGTEQGRGAVVVLHPGFLDHLMVNVDGLMAPECFETTGAAKNSSGEATAQPPTTVHTFLAVGESMAPEEEPLLQMVECRICQEEDGIKNLESPCACTGSLKYAHRACVQRWCNEKGDVTCEICHEPYEHGYTAPTRPHTDETTIDISGGWTITGTAFDLRDPRILAVAQNHVMEAEYDDYSATNASTAAFCRSAALVIFVRFLFAVAGETPSTAAILAASPRI
uniref:RING-CH-type domain-containing protein n=1 Tax=Oryza punctata TaxID=4537 RepID=A0A0E0M156_ORYPU